MKPQTVANIFWGLAAMCSFGGLLLMGVQLAVHESALVPTLMLVLAIACAAIADRIEVRYDLDHR